ncbi:tripartite tricarboxylate transporter permease [Marinobacter zhejiangensis]|uniref:Putative tricarboxylic transport membrane protein n=1 Tax=Marinobacter zhejiangensis TaxID=488535 RepID=A0A1I4NTG4_9GAMM|nr:tripartite tricarboxylate transporter permease [Marinobacter zhejiangensis]SFM18818.1 putative tricarboxylic transport membrane protein [Marinobacter zhejiangensis]
MIDLSILQQGLAMLASPWTFLALSGGLAGGVLIGALPGLTATMAVAVLAPFTFFMDATIGIPFLLGIYKGAIYGGSIPAILINTPGTAAAAATARDGYALTCQGKSRKALELSLYSSVVADLIATLVLIAVAIPLAKVAMKFGSPEFTLLYLIALTMIATVSGNSFLKGLIAAGLGLLVACIGLDPMSGYQRFTFGSTDLLAGVSLIPLLIGMFALSEILMQLGRPRATSGSAGTSVTQDCERLRWAEFWALRPTILRATSLGTFLGSLPGLGAEIACWIAYGVERGRSKEPERFGEGSTEGLAAAEAGNNAVVPAALIPMTVFGIPGDTVTAVLIGALMAQGMMPGPLLVQQNPGFLFGLFLVLLATNVLLLVFGLAAIRWLKQVSSIPPAVMYPCVLLLCLCGTYSVNSSSFDLLILAFGGGLGYLMRCTGFPVAPLIIGLLLGPGFESALRQSLVFSNGSLEIFWSRPGSLILLSILALVVAVMAWRGLKRTGARSWLSENRRATT